jgi:hypothetical protein
MTTEIPAADAAWIRRVNAFLVFAVGVFWLAGIIGVGVLREIPFRPYLVASLLLPCLAFALPMAFPERFARSGNDRVNLFVACLGGVVALVGAAIVLSPLSWDYVAPASLVSGGLLTALLVRLSPGRSKSGIAALMFGASAFSFGALMCVNMEFDAGPPRVHQVEILKMHRYPRSTPFATISPWGPYSRPVHLSQSLWLRLEGRRAGQQLCVHVWPGLLWVPWHRVQECGAR